VTDDVNYRLFVLPATKEQLLFFSIADMHATIMAVVFACTGAPLICSSRYVRLTDWDCNLHELGQDIWQAQPTELYNFSNRWTNSSFAFKALQPKTDFTCTSLIPLNLSTSTVVSVQLAAHGPTKYGTTISLLIRRVLLEKYSAQEDNEPLIEASTRIHKDRQLSQNPTTVNATIYTAKHQTQRLDLQVTGAPVGFTFAFGDGVLATNCSIFNNTRPVAG
jgi:hypothetical protein